VLEGAGNRGANHMIHSESYHPSLYKPYLVYINRGLVAL
jgi:hypothetical protein